VSMTGKIEQVEVITSVQRRRRWSADEKAAVVQETYAPGMSISLVARRHGIAPNQLFRRRRLYVEGALSAPSADTVRSKKTRPAPTRGNPRPVKGVGPKLGRLASPSRKPSGSIGARLPA
jgi:transposase-like protein